VLHRGLPDHRDDHGGARAGACTGPSACPGTVACAIAFAGPDACAFTVAGASTVTSSSACAIACPFPGAFARPLASTGASAFARAVASTRARAIASTRACAIASTRACARAVASTLAFANADTDADADADTGDRHRPADRDAAVPRGTTGPGPAAERAGRDGGRWRRERAAGGSGTVPDPPGPRDAGTCDAADAIVAGGTDATRAADARGPGLSA